MLVNLSWYQPTIGEIKQELAHPHTRSLAALSHVLDCRELSALLAENHGSCFYNTPAYSVACVRHHLQTLLICSLTMGAYVKMIHDHEYFLILYFLTMKLKSGQLIWRRLTLCLFLVAIRYSPDVNEGVRPCIT